MDEFVTIYEEVIKILKQLFGTRSDVFLITGSGSAGLEASIISLIEPGDKVIADDYYLRFLEVVGAKVILLERGRGEAITPSMIERILKKEHDVKAVAIAHNDTAQGITNPINEIGEIVKNYGALFIVDAVSSLGGIPIKFDEWHIDICSSGTQKALSAPPGLAPIAVSEHAWGVITNRKTPIPSRYLNLLSYREAVEKMVDGIQHLLLRQHH
jgi:aspartate aminotransferase-like enzyme